MSFNLENAPSQKGKIAIVTGANVGLGYETVISLAKKDMKVIMACRNGQKAENAKNTIMQKMPKADLEMMILDLSSLAAVRAFAKEFMEKYQQLDLLINNAGIMYPPFAKTEDGFESQWGINYLGHFLLTNLLFGLLNKTPGSRVVSLSSLAHKNGKIDFENLNSEKDYSKMAAYNQSKLACLMFAYELQRRIDRVGSGILSVAAHPGVSNTNLGRHIPKVLRYVLSLFSPLFTHSPEKAALPTLYAAIGEDVKGGEYFGPTGFKEMKGKPGKVASSALSHNKDIASRLWEVSEKLTGQEFKLY